MLKDVENQIVKSNLGIATRFAFSKMILFATLQDVKFQVTYESDVVQRSRIHEFINQTYHN